MEKKEIIDAITDGVKPINDDVKTVKDSVSAMDTRLKKIEALPLEKFTSAGIVGSDKFLGYDLNKQASFIKRQIGKIPFDSFHK